MRWRIVVNHININVGDSALIRIYDDKSPATIAKAILIDGGEKDLPAETRLIPFLAEKLEHKIQTHAGSCNAIKPLDAIVVSHFDKDHVGGVTTLFNYIKQKEYDLLVKKGVPTKIKDFKNSAYVFVRPKADEWPTSLFFVDTNKSSKKAIKEIKCATGKSINDLVKTLFPLTMFTASGDGAMPDKRALDWTVFPIIKSYTNHMPLDRIVAPFFSKTAIYDPGKYIAGKTTNQTKLITNYRGFIGKNPARGLIRKSNPDDEEINIIGHELIWDDSPGLLTGPQILNGDLKDLRAANSKSGNKPALFCIAANKRVIETKIPFLPMIVDRGKSGAPTEGSSIDLNDRSIALVLVDEKDSILQYFGGDLEEKIENKVVQWLKKNISQAIPVIKISHHGSRWATSPTLIRECYPRLAVVSVGTKFAHPNLELMLLVADYNEQQNEKQKTAPGMMDMSITLCATNYPYSLFENRQFKDTLKGLLNEKNLEALEAILKSPVIIALLKNDLKDGGIGPADVKRKQEKFINEIWPMNCKGQPSGAESKVNRTPLYPVSNGAVPEYKDIEIEYKAYNGGLIAVVTQGSTHVFEIDPLFPSLLLSHKPQPAVETSRLASSDICMILASTSDKIAVIGDIRLANDCELDKFIKMLKGQYIVLRHVKKDDKDNRVIGTIVEDLGDWFARIGIQQVDIEFIGTLVEGKLMVFAKDVVFKAQLDTSLNRWGSKAPSITPIFVGKLQKDTSIIFSLISENVNTSILGNAKFVDYLSSSGLLGELDKLLNLTYSLVRERTQITFNPYYCYSAEIQLTNSIKDTLSIKELKMAFEKIEFTMASRKKGMSSASLSNEFWCEFDTELKWGEFRVQTTVQLRYDGIGKFSFSPMNGDISKLVIQAFPTDSFLDALDPLIEELGGIGKIERVTVSFDIVAGKLISLHIVGGFTFLQSTPLIIDFLFPACVISGYMKTSASKEEKDIREEKKSSDDKDDQEETESLYTSNLTFTSFIEKYKQKYPIKSPDALSNFRLANLSFLANPRSGDYDFQANLTSEKDGIWPFHDEIKLTNISIRLARQEDCFSIRIESILNLGDTIIEIIGRYDSDKWNFEADISEIDLNDFINLFAQKCRAQLAKVIPNIKFIDAQLKLNYISQGKNTFSMHGIAQIASENFQISYDSGLDEPLFLLTWESTTTKLSLVHLLKEICRKEDNFLQDLDEDLISINLKKVEIALSPTAKNLIVKIVTENGMAIFINQSAIKEGREPIESLQALYFSLALDLHLPNIPVAGSLPFPIEKIELLKLTRKLTANDIAQLKCLIPLIDEKSTTIDNLQLVFTPKKEISANKLILPLSSKTSPVVFSEPRLSSILSSELETKDTETKTSVVTTELVAASNTSAQAKWFNIQKTMGPLNVKRLGLNYQRSKLWLLFDASVAMGGLTIDILGLAVGVQLNQPTEVPKIQLDGLGIGYQSGPLTINGGFLRDQIDSEERYSGTAVVRTEGLNLSAMGSYSQIKVEGESATKPSLFIFVRLTRPLGGPPYFYVTGLSGGFGYNQLLRIPKQDEVVNFPLVKGTSGMIGDSDEPLKVLASLFKDKWLTAKLGEQWFAFGVDFTTFKLISTRALAIVGLGSELQISVLGRSELRLPIAYAEMGLRAYCNPSRGVLELSALLGPNSYVFHPDCHLTGGFAFYTWFSGEKSGDFALTLGGYHPRYQVPSHYPIVPRLGFNWKMDNMTIKGEAYFALTPACVMAGGGLEAAYQSGDLRAWFHAYANFLIHWKPFYYDADIDVSVGASYKLNMLFTSTTVSVELGASVQLYGPPTSGTARVRWWVISFTVHFGDDKKPVLPLTWGQFIELLPKDKSGSLILNRITVKKGLLTEKPNNTWIVRPDDLEIQTESAIPTSAITFIATAKDTEKDIDLTKINEKDHTINNPKPFYIKPMKTTAAVESTHKVIIKAPGANIPDWKTHILTRNIPEALWGKPSNESGDSPSLTTQTLIPDSWVGLSIGPPDTEQGPAFGPIEMKKAFGDISVKTAIAKGVSASTTFAPCQEVKITEIIRTGVNAESTVKKRSEAVDCLRKMGLFKASDALTSLTKLAAKVDEVFIDSPLKIQGQS